MRNNTIAWKRKFPTTRIISSAIQTGKFVAVYSDIASGTRIANRPGYQKLMKDCTKRKVDLILVKSLSRFSRDALETIRQIRRLKKMNIGVYIEKGGLNTLNISNSMIDQLAALDQAESQFRSENIKFGIRHRMRSGKTVLNHTQFLGYTKGPDGILQVVPEEAAQTAYIKATTADTMAVLNRDMEQLRALGFRYVLLDEVTLIRDFIDSAALLSDVYAAQGMKIVLSGTDSLGFWFGSIKSCMTGPRPSTPPSSPTGSTTVCWVSTGLMNTSVTAAPSGPES